MEYNKELCDERHSNLKDAITKTDHNVGKLFKRLDWFYVLVIATLIGTVANLFLK